MTRDHEKFRRAQALIADYVRSLPIEASDAYCKCGHPGEAHGEAGMCWLAACGCGMFRPAEDGTA